MPKHVYGIVGESTPAPKQPGIGEAQVELVAGDGTAALVSEVPDGQTQVGREELLRHAQVLEDALAHGTVLPMRFGVVLDGPDAVRRDLLDAHREELRSQLEQLEGKVEARIRAMYEEEPLMREVVQQNPDIRQLRDSMQGQPEDATYYARIELGELVSEAIDHKRRFDAEQILDALMPHALAVEIADPSHERSVLDASFLVERTRLAEFDQRVEDVAKDRLNRIRVRYTGPLPPHSFVELAGAA